jgi:hypothetical protein
MNSQSPPKETADKDLDISKLRKRFKMKADHYEFALHSWQEKKEQFEVRSGPIPLWPDVVESPLQAGMLDH